MAEGKRGTNNNPLQGSRKVVTKSINFINDSYDDAVNDNNGNDAKFIIYWNNLTYQVYRAPVDIILDKFKRGQENVSQTRTILNNVSGSFKAGEMTALMGPSGAGKTTLLECLIGKRRIGLSGEINVRHFDATQDTKIILALVPQKSDFFECFTVHETIAYSSKLKASHISDEGYHRQVTERIIKRLDLGNVSSSSVLSLSGSERKRLAIGIEIVNQPNLLVLDEPTTGLDSFAAQMVVNLLYSISREGVAVIMTIHQPSWNIFRMFDKIYMLSPIVQRCIYQGAPTKIIPYLKEKYYLEPKEGITPPDYITDVASGLITNAKTVLMSMADDASKVFEEEVLSKNGTTANEMTLSSSLSGNDNEDVLSSFKTLLKRELTTQVRSFGRFWIIFITGIITPLISMFFLGYVTSYLGCPISMDDISSEEMSPAKFISIIEHNAYEIRKMAIPRDMMVMIQMSGAFMSAFFPMFYLKSDLVIVWREVKNSSYNSNIYIIVKMISDLSFIYITMVVYTVESYYLLGGNPNDAWRFFLSLLALVLSTTFCHSMITLVACLFRHSELPTIIFISLMTSVPHYMVSNHLINPDRALDIYSLLGWMGFYRFDVLMISTGGFDACGMDIRQRIVSITNLVIKWMYETMSLSDANGYYINSALNTFNMSYNPDAITGGNKLLSSFNVSEIMDSINELGSIFSKDATKYFIARDGEVRAALVTSSYDLIDSDVGRLLTTGLIWLLIVRMAASFLMKYAIHETF